MIYIVMHEYKESTGNPFEDPWAITKVDSVWDNEESCIERINTLPKYDGNGFYTTSIYYLKRELNTHG